MGQIVDGITPELKRFIEAQPVFFVASAPLGPNGHVNLSPKGWTRSASCRRTAWRISI